MQTESQVPQLQPVRSNASAEIAGVAACRSYVAIELRPIVGDLRLKAIEDILGKPSRIRGGLDHQRRHGTDKHSLGHATLAVTRQITHDLAATGGVADVDGVPQIKMRGDS